MTLNSKRISSLLTLVLVLASSFSSGVHAESATLDSNNNLVVSPSQIVMQINDLGKKYTLKITNNSKNTLVLKASEVLITPNTDGSGYSLLEKPITTKFVELPSSSFIVNAGQSFDLSVRTKIVNTATLTDLPAVAIKQSNEKSPDTNIPTLYVPFIIQSATGKLTMNTDLSINVDSFTSKPDITITGRVSNAGDKFFNPKGTLVILKDNVKLQEQEITSQIGGILFSDKTKDYQYNWTNPNASWDAVGEYTIESRVSNDLTDKTTVSSIKFIYIPSQLIYIVVGGLTGLITLLIVVHLIRQVAKRPKK